MTFGVCMQDIIIYESAIYWNQILYANEYVPFDFYIHYFLLVYIFYIHDLLLINFDLLYMYLICIPDDGGNKFDDQNALDFSHFIFIKNLERFDICLTLSVDCMNVDSQLWVLSVFLSPVLWSAVSVPSDNFSDP